jgi:amino acid transporter
MRISMDPPSGRAEQTRGRSLFFLRAALLVVVIPALVIVSYGAFALQGHQEDFPSKPMQTWPIGVSALTLAAALAWVATRPSRGLQPLVAVVALVCFMVTWAAYLS